MHGGIIGNRSTWISGAKMLTAFRYQIMATLQTEYVPYPEVPLVRSKFPEAITFDRHLVTTRKIFGEIMGSSSYSSLYSYF